MGKRAQQHDEYDDVISDWLMASLVKRVGPPAEKSMIPMARIGRRSSWANGDQSLIVSDTQLDDDNTEFSKRYGSMLPMARIGRSFDENIPMIPMARIGKRTVYNLGENAYHIPMPRIG
jgi:hypothetical protein